MQKLKKLPWAYACVSRYETKWRNIENTSEFSDDEETVLLWIKLRLKKVKERSKSDIVAFKHLWPCCIQKYLHNQSLHILDIDRLENYTAFAYKMFQDQTFLW